MTCIGLVLLILGASPYPVWQNVYDAGKTDMCHGMCLDSNDHVLIVGETNQASNYDSWMIALSKSGDSLWSLLYDDGGDEKGFSIATTHEGNIAVATRIINQPAAQINLYDPNGELIWERQISMKEVNRVIATSDNKIYISGWGVSDEHYIYVYGYDETGQLVLLISEPTGSKALAVSDLVVDPLGYIYIGLYKEGPCAIWTYSPDGELEWFREYGNFTTRCFGLGINKANHLFQSGDFSAGTHFDFLLLKWKNSGNLIWPEHKAYDLGDFEYCRDLKLDSISDCYLAGWQARGSDEDVALVKTDSAGSMLWAWVDTLEGKQEIEAIEVDEDGYIYLAGSHHNGEDWDMLVMKVCQPLTITGRVTDSTGKAMEDVPVSLAGDTAVEVITDTGGYYFIEAYNGGEYTVSPNLPGWSFEPSSRTYSPLAHREFDQDFENGRWTCVEESPLLLEFNLQVTHNRILYQVPYQTYVKIGVYDVSGRFVYEVVDGEVEPGNHSFDLKGYSRTLASGVYFVKMVTDDYKKTVKVVILE
jgi:hypothetical protein